MFSVIVLFLFHCDSTGLAAARTEVLAFREQMIPAFAMDKVCCSCNLSQLSFHSTAQQTYIFQMKTNVKVLVELEH